MTLKQILFFYLFIIISINCYAEDSHESEIKDEVKHSFAPIGGYNPTYGVFFGGGYFLKSKVVDMTNLTIITFDKVFRYENETQFEFLENWKLIPAFRIDIGFIPNYGTEAKTQKSSLSEVFGRNLITGLSVERKWNHFWKMRIGYEYLIWDRYKTEGSSFNTIEPDEFHSVLSSLHWDNTVVEGKMRKGWVAVLNVKARLGSQMNLSSKLRYSRYFLLSDEVSLASNSIVGAVLGPASFFTDFTLGGTDALRGFLKNRFRGNQLYLQQFELRFPIYKALSGVSFVDVGEATRESFGSPHFSYGAGLRFGLPPDEVQKIRVDVGKSHDQFGVFFDFGQAF